MEDLRSIAKNHMEMAQQWTLTVQGAWWMAIQSLERTAALVEESQKKLHRSDQLLQWCETFGPRPVISAEGE